VYQLDVWTDTVSGYPCQISAQRISDQKTTTFAFDGFNTIIPPSAKLCIAAKMQCAQRDWECHAKKTATPNALSAALGWVCSNQDCSPINPGGKNYLPNTLVDHCNWAFTTYFRAYKMDQGYSACDFSGNAELVPPNTTRVERSIVESLDIMQNNAMWGPDFVC